MITKTLKLSRFNCGTLTPVEKKKVTFEETNPDVLDVLTQCVQTFATLGVGDVVALDRVRYIYMPDGWFKLGSITG